MPFFSHWKEAKKNSKTANISISFLFGQLHFKIVSVMLFYTAAILLYIMDSKRCAVENQRTTILNSGARERA